jgi:hypothetical protein
MVGVEIIEEELTLERLEHLSLVSRVISELENHFGITDKDVAEFVIDLARTNITFDKFKKALETEGLAEGVRIILFLRWHFMNYE